MSEDLSDEVFVLENGIITNHNIPLILQHDLGGDGARFGLGDEFPDFAAVNANQMVQDDLGGNLPGVAQEDPPSFPGMGMPQNGVHQSMSSTHSSVQSSSSVAFEQGEVLGTSTPAFEAELGCYVNPSYQSSVSDLSEFNPSVEIQPVMETGIFKDLAKSTPGNSEVKENSGESKESQSSGFSDNNKGTQVCFANTGNIAEASTSTLEDNEVIIPNPPNSPTEFGRCLSRSRSTTQLLRRYASRTPLRVDQLNHPDRPSSIFRKFGALFLIPSVILPLAVIACLEKVLPCNSVTTLVIFWILCVMGSIGCFIKACWEEQNLSPESPAFTSGYGSTGMTRPALSTTPLNETTI